MSKTLVYRLCGPWLLCFCLIGVSFVCVADSELPRGVTRVTQVEGITEYRLKNGLQVLLFPDPSKETVTVNVTYKVGSKHENYGETGMAHLLEHLMFKGSKKHKDIPAEMSAHGAEANGTTSYDRTNYYETFAATDANIDWALRLEADRMVNAFIARKDLDSEMTVVRNEFERAETSTFGVLMRGMMASAYRWHSYGKPTIGSRSDIENVSIERLRDFYEHYYQPDNAVLTVAGKFEPDRLLPLIRKHFGRIAKPKRELPRLYTVEPPQDGEKSVVVRRVGDIQWLAAAYHIPAGSHPDYAALEVLAEILGETPRGRLHKELVEKKLAVGTFGFPYQLQDPGLLFFAAQVDKKASLDAARDAFLAVVEGAKRVPVTEDEVERVKRNLAKQITLAFNSSQSIAISLSEYIGMGDWRLLFLTRDRIEQVTVADVQRVADQYLVRNNRIEGRFVPTVAPERVEIPAVESVETMLEGYTGRGATVAGEAFAPSFDNIAARTRKLTLPGGAAVALLPKKTRGESVVLQLAMQYGTVESLRQRSTIADLTGAMLMRGTRRYNRQELQDRLDELQASANIGGSITGAYASVVTTREKLVEVIDLVANVLREPSFDASELALLQDRMVANLEASRQEPQSIVSREMQRYFNPWPPGHPYYIPTVDEEIAAVKAVTVADLQQFHRDFYGASAMQLALVGDFAEDAIEEALRRTFANWRSAEPYARIAEPYQPLEKVDVMHRTPDKENASLVAMLAVPVGEEHPDAAALELGTYIFGGGFLNSRLVTRLRQQDGLSYSSGAWLGLDSVENSGQFSAYAIFAPQNRAAVEAGIREELRRVLDKGFTEAELAAAKSGMLQQARVDRTQNGHLAALLANNLELGRDMKWHAAREAQIEALTPSQVLTAMRKYLDEGKLSFVRAGDFDKAPKPAAK